MQRGCTAGTKGWEEVFGRMRLTDRQEGIKTWRALSKESELYPEGPTENNWKSFKLVRDVI